MNNFLEELKRYFENKSSKEISENLAKYDVEINNIGPTVEDFLSNCNQIGASSQGYASKSYCEQNSVKHGMKE